MHRFNEEIGYDLLCFGALMEWSKRVGQMELHLNVSEMSGLKFFKLHT